MVTYEDGLIIALTEDKASCREQLERKHLIFPVLNRLLFLSTVFLNDLRYEID